MKVIGIVGGIGAGKSTVVELMMAMAPIEYVSADQVGHQILLKGQPAYEPVVQAFGTTILNTKGEIERYKLAQIVFKDNKQLERLNQITHPIIFNQIEMQIKKQEQLGEVDFILLEAALLIESGLTFFTDKIIGVYAEPEIRLNRAMQRDHASKEQILKRMQAQMDWETMKKACDYIIDNSFSKENTQKQIKKMMEVL